MHTRILLAQARIEYVMVDNPQPKFSRLPFAPVIADSALVMRGRRASTATSVMLDRLHEASEVCSRCHSFTTSYQSPQHFYFTVMRYSFLYIDN